MSFGGKDNRGPSIAELQRYIREQIELVFTLHTGQDVVGKLRWFDENAFSVAQDGQQPFTILRSAVVGYRKHGAGGMKTNATASKPDQGLSSPQTLQQEQQPQPPVTTIEEQRADE